MLYWAYKNIFLFYNLNYNIQIFPFFLVFCIVLALIVFFFFFNLSFENCNVFSLLCTCRNIFYFIKILLQLLYAISLIFYFIFFTFFFFKWGFKEKKKGWKIMLYMVEKGGGNLDILGAKVVKKSIKIAHPASAMHSLWWRANVPNFITFKGIFC